MINILVLVSLILFYILFIGRTILLMRQGVKVWVISSTKDLKGKILELLLVPLLVFWSLLVFLIFLLGAVGGIHAQILREERFLSMKFGEEYSHYKNTVRRYL
ncbi:MAG TPA: hypothetical protein VN381_15710 [Anaerovoracaceae bacterium]|nr:hypothetical protein [Anaerovoracaceae bacterium]